MRKSIFGISFFLLCSMPAIWPNTSSPAETNETPFVVRVKDNLVTVKVKDIPLNKVLTEIAHQASIRIVFAGSTEEPLSADFSDLPLDQGLKRLIQGFNSVIIYGPKNLKTGESEIKEVILCSRKGASPLKISGPGKIVPPKNQKPPLEDFQLKAEADALRDKDPEIRKNAAEALGNLEDEMALIPLLQALLDKNSRVKKSAVDALCRIGGENVIRALQGCQSSDDEDLKKIASEALKRLEAEK